MILEVADIRVAKGQEVDFEAAVHKGLTEIFPRAKGFQGYEIRRSLESSDRYLLLLRWDTLEDHTVGFRQSPAYSEWRALVGPHFAGPPFVEHFQVCAPLDA